ncbi:dihydroorotate dehydrogenase [Paenibacillus septentrionalis]|uniref:Dihydroorotate dehydrogenase n=1 Tax=Paenibacillus septentrionalis TaxID=429342 RepID=A0ABW1V8J8_9BACL
MPDWSYHPLKRLLLDALTPATSRAFIHKSMNTIASLPGGRSLIQFLGHMNPPQSLHKVVGERSFSSPIGLSSLMDSKLSGIKAFQELGFGFLEIGPIVLHEPHNANPPIIENGQLMFSHQHEQVPLKLALRTLASMEQRVPIFARIDKHVTKPELELLVQHLTPYVDAFVASPILISSFIEQPLVRPLYASFSADEWHLKNWTLEPELTPLLTGIVITAPRHSMDEYWHEADNANECLASIVSHVKVSHPQLAVVTSGGVNTPEQALRLMHAGADLLLLTDGYVKAGPGLPKRIHERLCFEDEPHPAVQKWRWSFWFGMFILMGGFIALYFAFTSIILPYDEAFLGLTRAELHQLNPRILAFMSHDRMALAGTMISGGILYVQLARHGIRYGMHWAKVAFHSAAIIGFLGIFLFIGYGYFDWLHGLFWLILLPAYYFSYIEGKKAQGAPRAKHDDNDKAWQLANIGQLMFVLLGFAIVIGGIVISTIGVTHVFVTTDLLYICMSPEMLDEMNRNLIPVIAHDRAGFGSALISVGLLVLMISLWGFRKGERWVWNSLAVGALPAFIAGIGTHFYIGYTTFIHLLPVYVLVVLYVLGLALSYSYLKKR